MLNLAFFLQQDPSPDQISHIVVAAMAILPLIILIFVAIIIIPFWFICKKAGFSPWLSLLNLVPAGNLILSMCWPLRSGKLCPRRSWGIRRRIRATASAATATAAPTAAVRR